MSVDIKERSIALIAGNAEALNAIRDEGTAIAIWERSTPPGLSALNLDGIFDVRFTADVEKLSTTLDDALDDAGHERGDARNILHKDVLALANRFAKVMRSEFVEVRLEHVTTNACRKFHADYVTARLITTYLGQGTQWLDGDDAADCDCGDPHNIQQMRAGDVALFKGRLWSQDTPAIHRSPPIEGTGEERLMLVINPVQRSRAV
ncbi:DUF1826 domain-containing protein [Sphingorhabdus sp. Alg231-15]|uniref:DUF1826 domain-containing protein n=1 Tax=Sphingorhabdus sp. Alg231-15 TaxID=1922222 RepID=UPI000D5533A4